MGKECLGGSGFNLSLFQFSLGKIQTSSGSRIGSVLCTLLLATHGMHLRDTLRPRYGEPGYGELSVMAKWVGSGLVMGTVLKIKRL